MTKTSDSSHKNFNIAGINFTSREVDVLACVLHNRKEKKIAELLSISPRTVESHIVNIRMKLSCCSKDSLIDCIEASNQILYLKNHYCKILIRNMFLTKLGLIKQLLAKKTYNLEIRTNYQNKLSSSLVKKITRDLTGVGITLCEVSEDKKEDDNDLEDYILCFLPSEHQTQSIYVTNKKHDRQLEYIDFSDSSQYMISLMHLIEKITALEGINNIILDFIVESKNLSDGFFNPNFNSQNNNTAIEYKKRLPRMLVYFFVFILLVSGVIFCVNYNTKTPQQITSSDLDFPKFYLKRDGILKQMDKLLSVPNKISTIALVGMGGAGKTTLALQYANMQDASIVWKIDAETPTSTMVSLEGLAYALCKTPLDKEEFYNIQKIGDIFKKEYMIGVFLKSKALLYKKWIMIYDNVTNFSDIQRLLPHDIKSWGSEGKVIITTANSNISNNNYFSNNNIIYVPELNDLEKLELYTHILNIKNTDYKKDPNIQILLNKIPPFPLDVVQAAYYIKSTGVKPSQYIKYITKKEDDFLKLEKSILNSISNYSNTRNNIVELSLNMIQQQQEEARTLLLLLSIINGENIPKSLLAAYKGEIVVNKFLQNMQNFSLIKENNNQEGTLSLHQSIQSSFLKNLDKTIHQKDYDNIALFFIDFIEKELQKKTLNKELSVLISHLETLLDYYYSFSPESLFAIRNILGNLYNQCLNDLPKAINILEYGRLVALQQNKATNINLAKNSIYLHDIYCKLGDFKKAKKFLLEAEQIYKSKLSPNIPPYLDSLLQKARNNQRIIQLKEDAKKTI